MINNYIESDFEFLMTLIESEGRTKYGVINESYTIRNEYLTSLSNFIPALSRSPWRAVLAYYETFDGINEMNQSIGVMDHSNDSPKLIRAKLARLILKTCSQLSDHPISEITLSDWLKKGNNLSITNKYKLLWDSIALLKLVFRTFNIEKV